MRRHNGRQGRKTIIRVDTRLAQKQAGHSESSARRGIKVGGHTPKSGASGPGWGSTESSPRGHD